MADEAAHRFAALAAAQTRVRRRRVGGARAVRAQRQLLDGHLDVLQAGGVFQLRRQVVLTPPPPPPPHHRSSYTHTKPKNDNNNNNKNKRTTHFHGAEPVPRRLSGHHPPVVVGLGRVALLRTGARRYPTHKKVKLSFFLKKNTTRKKQQNNRDQSKTITFEKIENNTIVTISKKK